eukprot:NODE_325_length_9674_cov_0.932846.p9 type:complete len:181 gc:universal NODE_325_length_9674_cov_0.932846:3001-2459(-)
MIENYGKFPEKLVVSFTNEILSGLRYLHKKHIIHRDIKSTNILVGDKGKCKLSDFGYAMNERKKHNNSFIDERFLRNSNLESSVYWMAPEVVTRLHYSAKSDVWAVACVIVEMFSAENPYGPGIGQIEALFKLSKLERPTIPENLSTAATNFLQLGFSIDDSIRPDVEQLLSSDFLRKKK